MSIKEKLKLWKQNKSLALASEICQELAEMLDEDSDS